MLLLVGDVGGTSTRLAVIRAEDGPRRLLAQGKFQSGSYPTLEAMIRDFLQREGMEVEGACFGIAGPVVDGRAQMTNLSWSISAADLRGAMGWKAVHLLNDLQAMAYAIPALAPGETLVLQEGQAKPQGTIALLAAGTGLGEATFAHDGQAYRAYPSEGGHCDFAPLDRLQAELLVWMWDRFPHVSYERLCSGVGLPNLYAFFRHKFPEAEPPDFAASLAAANDPTPLIVQAALASPPLPLCRDVLGVFCSILGAEASNLALKTLATGGVFLGGGFALRIQALLQGPEFLQGFHAKGRYEALMRSLPVRLILHQEAGLLGAAAYAIRHV